MLHAFGLAVAICCGMLDGANRASAHAQAQQCCGPTSKISCNIQKCCEMLGEKFDHFQTWFNIVQPVVTYCNRVAKRLQHAERNNVGICCVEMLRVFGWALKHPIVLK